MVRRHIALLCTILFAAFFVANGTSGVRTKHHKHSESEYNDDHDDLLMHPRMLRDKNSASPPVRARPDPAERDAAHWEARARDAIRRRVAEPPRRDAARNTILFMGDGMSVPTLAAARAYAGQRSSGGRRTGEEYELSFEKFPVVGLAKTYCVDSQVPDSACTATAYLCGSKTNLGTIGVTAKVERDNCEQMVDEANHVHSIAKKFIDDGRSAGLVTTTRVTHASPAGLYAHTADREWENDLEVMRDKLDPTKCRDIAHQLVYGTVGKDLKVILGGGRREFLGRHTTDEEGHYGNRMDEKDLIAEWEALKRRQFRRPSYVWNRDQLRNVGSDEYVLGLFESSHCEYNMYLNRSTDPTLTEMVEAAVRVLSSNKKGYFLFVEGGRIDHAHHENLAHVALDETVELARAVEKARGMTDEADTLVVVISDHSHTMTLNGYPPRGNDVLGVTGNKGADRRPYTTLSYANGPGYRVDRNGKRPDPTKELDFGTPEYVYPAMVPIVKETHGGDDVAIFASGPWQHLFTGVHEQSNIPYIIEWAACLNDECHRSPPNL